MAAYPEPGHHIVVHDAGGTVSEGDPDRPDIFGLVDVLEAQSRMATVTHSPRTNDMLSSMVPEI